MDKPLIMVVDDEWLNRELLESYLQFHDYRVLLAHSGNEALKLAEADPPDVAVIDVRLPGMNGYEVSRLLKENDATNEVRIILVSGLPLDDSQVTGADDFIDRSILTDELATRIERLLNEV